MKITDQRSEREQPTSSDDMLAAARREVIGDKSPSEQMVEEAKKSFETEQHDSFSGAMAEAAKREKEARAAANAIEFQFEERRARQAVEPVPPLTRHRTGPKPGRTSVEAPVPQDPFERKPRGSRRLRRLIPLAIVAFIVINSLLDQDIGSYLQELWNELFGGGSSGPQ